MSEIKRTAGPWSYDRGIIPPDGPGRYSTVSADGDVVIAEVNDLISEGIANARLIAAAPDLLEALQELLAYGLRMSAKHEAPAFVKARAAIAKALGESE